MSLEREGTSVDRANMSLVMKIVEEDGTTLPFGTLTDALVQELIQNAMEVIPLHILIVNEQDILVDFPGDADVYKVSRAIHGPALWRNEDIQVNCLMSTHASLISIEKEWEKVCAQLDDLQKACEWLEKEEKELAIHERESEERLQHETSKMQTHFVEYRDQMNCQLIH